MDGTQIPYFRRSREGGNPSPAGRASATLGSSPSPSPSTLGGGFGGRAERLAASAWLIFKRSLANWRSLLPLVAGLVLASAIMAGTTIYYDALNNLAFSRALVEHAPEDLDMSWLSTGSVRPPLTYTGESSDP